MEFCLLRLCIFQTALKNTFFPWYYFRTLERPGKDMVSLGGYAQAASMHKLVFIIFAVLRDQKPFELKTPEQHAVEQGFVKAA